MKQTLSFCQFGANQGRKVFYFHGVPGAPEELGIFDDYGKVYGLNFICLDRFSIDASITGEAYYRYLAKQIATLADGSSVDFIGFSIGAFIALQTSLYMAGDVRQVHLISAAAPLEAGNFINEMAGKQIFRLAKAFPGLFMLLSYWQSLLAYLSPSILFRLLFASAKGADKVLVNAPEFKAQIAKVLRTCFMTRTQGYVRDIKAYVQPWASTLAEITVNTHIWHGATDNWSPIGMAEYLYSAIPGCSGIEKMDEMSHYSCLYKAVPIISKQLSKT